MRRGVLSTPSVACTTVANVCTRNLGKKSLSKSLVTIYDLSIDDRAIGDLSIERLAIECLPTSSANVITKMTRVTVGITSPSSGSATPTVVGGLGPLCFAAWFLWASGGMCLCFLALHEGLPRLL